MPMLRNIDLVVFQSPLVPQHIFPLAYLLKIENFFFNSQDINDIKDLKIAKGDWLLNLSFLP